MSCLGKLKLCIPEKFLSNYLILYNFIYFLQMSINDENRELVFFIEEDFYELFQKCALNYMNKQGIPPKSLF